MKKSTYKILIGVGAVAVCFAVANVTAYALKKQNVVEFLFQNSSQEDYDKKYMVDVGKSIEVDGYTITLEKELYIEKTGYGMCYFTVKKDGMDMREIYVDPPTVINVFETFGENYTIMPLNNTATLTFEKEKDKLNIYAKFTIEKHAEPDKIQIFDLDLVKTNYEEAIVGEFELEDSGCTVKLIGNSKKEIWLSPFSISIDEISEVKDIIIKYKDGESVYLKKDRHLMDKGQGMESRYGYTERGESKTNLFFKQPFDYLQVESVIVDGIEYRTDK